MTVLTMTTLERFEERFDVRRSTGLDVQRD